MSKRVLLVDDSSTALMMEQMVLSSKKQYEVMLAHDGQEGVEKASSAAPDLVLMDVVMPRMNGYMACREMRRNPALKQVPIILVTTRGEEECVEEGFQSGCSDYITKPINPHELLAMLKNYLGE